MTPKRGGGIQKYRRLYVMEFWTWGEPPEKQGWHPLDNEVYFHRPEAEAALQAMREDAPEGAYRVTRYTPATGRAK